MSSLQSFKASVEGLVTEPHDPEYSIKRWASNAERPAKYVVYPKSNDDVSKAILFAKSENLEIAVRGGGHSASGASSVTGGLVIDLSKFFSNVRIDPEKKLAYTQGGAIWETVDREAIKHGLAAVAGVVNHTGVGGLTSGGGWGWLTGEHGLVIDNLVSATVVIASGDVLTANETENSDLFWGIRGGGSNFGVITEFVFKLHPQRHDLHVGFMFFAPETLEKVVGEVNLWLKERSIQEAANLLFAVGPTGQPVIGLCAVYNGDPVEGKAKFQRFANIGPIIDDSKTIPYTSLNELANSMATHGENKCVKGTFFKSLDLDSCKIIWERWHDIVTKEPEFIKTFVGFLLSPFEKVASVPKDATAYFARDPVYNFVAEFRWATGGLDDKARQYGRELAALADGTPVGQSSVVTGYSNYNDEDASASVEVDKARMLFGSNYERLQKVKRAYDPENVFHKWYPIVPASA